MTDTTATTAKMRRRILVTPPVEATVPGGLTAQRPPSERSCPPFSESDSRNEEGTVHAVTGSSKDVHQQPDDVFRLLVDSVEDYAIFMLDPTGHVASWNRGAAAIKGYSADEIIGKHFSV